MIRKRNIILILLCLLIFCGCEDSKKNNNATKNTTPPIINNEQEPSKEQPKVKIVDLDSNTRPYAVMINNINVARQVQSGLSDAYLVYEIIVEGGITRYLALFKDANVEQIGSVRSARHYYLDYVLENDAIYVHWGWSPQAQEDIKSLKINNINGLSYEGTYFYRSNPKKIASEHTGFTKTDMLNKAVDKLKYRKTTDSGLLLNYSAEEIEPTKYSGVSAKKITLTYSNATKNTYEYDEETKLYKRFVNGSAQKDFNTGKQLTVKNIIAYKIKNYTIKGDTKGRQFLDNVGSGSGYYYSNGMQYKITWSKDSRESKTKYYFENGEELVVNDGNTFIQIVPTTGSIGVD